MDMTSVRETIKTLMDDVTWRLYEDSVKDSNFIACMFAKEIPNLTIGPIEILIDVIKDRIGKGSEQ